MEFERARNRTPICTLLAFTCLPTIIIPYATIIWGKPINVHPFGRRKTRFVEGQYTFYTKYSLYLQKLKNISSSVCGSRYRNYLLETLSTLWRLSIKCPKLKISTCFQAVSVFQKALIFMICIVNSKFYHMIWRFYDSQ